MTTRDELVREYERRRLEAKRHGATAPLARTYAVVLADLRELDGTFQSDRLMNTSESASVLGVTPKTMRKWVGEGRFVGARKTSGLTGEWRIPAREVYAEAGQPEPRGRAESIPRLWTEDTDG